MTRKNQESLFPELNCEINVPKPVNVSVVPHRSPFRYPGGKTWFVPTFRQWIASMKVKPTMLIEPFAGGGIISLTALFEDLVQKVIMAEIDEDVAAVWECIVEGYAEWLANRILTFDMSREAVIRELNKTPRTKKEKAFHTILRNRTLHGGILAKGSRFIKYGENGKGIGSRWYPKTLARRLMDINYVRKRIDFRFEDGLKVIKEFSDKEDVAYFIDPPYTAGGKRAGKRLYKYYNLDHERLFEICRLLRGAFLITYDDSEEVKAMARKHGFQMRLIPMMNTHHSTKWELIMGKDLSWMNSLPAVYEPKVNYGTNGDDE